jgi:hypothetical protein
MPNTPIAALPYPALTDSPNGPAQIQALATAVDSQVVPRFATTAARDAAITAPVAGMECWTTTPATHWYYSGTAWIVRGGSAYGRCRLRRVAVQSIPNGAATAISWDTEDLDNGGYITATSATILIPTDLGGLYGITFNAVGPTSTTGRYFLSIVPTSTITGLPAEWRSRSDGVETMAVVHVETPLNAGDSFQCKVFQQNGAAVNHTAWLSCARLAPL